MQLYRIIFTSILATVVFGIIDALNFLLIEEKLTKFWKKTGFFDEETIPLVNGGISASIALFISSFVDSKIHMHFNVIKHPFLDSLGITLGTIIVIFIYKFWNDIKRYF